MTLTFNPKAFSLIWDLKPLTPEEHVAAVRAMLEQWEREKAKIEHRGMLESRPI